MFDALESLLAAKGFRSVVGVSHIWQGFARISLELHLIADEARNWMLVAEEYENLEYQEKSGYILSGSLGVVGLL